LGFTEENDFSDMIAELEGGDFIADEKTSKLAVAEGGQESLRRVL
jgi:hypothetical protein